MSSDANDLLTLLRREREAREAAELALEDISHQLNTANIEVAKRLKQSEALLAAIEKSEVAFLMLDLSMCVEYASNEFIRLFELDQGTINGKNYSELFSDYVAKQIERCINSISAVDEKNRFEAVTLSSTGKIRELGFKIVQTAAEKIILSITDFTQTRTQERAIGAMQEELALLDSAVQNRLKGEAISHDINNAVASISALVESSNISPEKERHTLRELIYKVSKNISDIEDLLTKGTIITEVNLLQLITQALNDARYMFRGVITFEATGFDRFSKIKIDEKLARYALLSAVRVFRHEIGQDASMIVRANMAQHDSSQTLSFHVGFDRDQSSADRPILLSSEAVEQISRLPELIGFNVGNVSSEVGSFDITMEYSTFNTLSVSKSISDQTQGGSVSNIDRGQFRVAVVDDDPLMAELIGKYVEMAKYTPEVFTDPREALAYVIQQDEHKLITISDLKMPNMTGEQLAHNIAKNNKSMPFILYTAQATYRIFDKSKYFKVLRKPVTPEQLEAVLNEAIVAIS